MRGDVRELQPAGDVAGREHTLDRGAAAAVGDDVALLELDAEPLEPEPAGAPAPAGRDQQRVAAHLLAAGAQHDLVEQPVEQLHDGDAAADPRERLRELEPDGAAAEHEQPRRKRLELEDRPVRQIWDAFDPVDRRYCRIAAGRHDEPSELQRLAIDAHRAGTDDLRLAVDDGDAHSLEPLVALVARDLLDDPRPPRGHRAKVERRRLRDQPLLGRPPQREREVRDLDQRLRGDAAVEAAVAAEPRLLLDQRHRRARVPRRERRRQPGGAAAEHHDVEPATRVSGDRHQNVSTA